MREIFLWFYCLPIVDLIIFVVIASTAYIWLRKWYHKVRGAQIIEAVLLIGWLSIIMYATAGQRSANDASAAVVLQPFHSYREVWNGGNPEIYRSNFMNVVLFYPAGLLAALLLPQKWPGWCRCVLVVAVFAAMSSGIEFLQYCYSLGQCEIDDVIHNTVGALLGSLAAVLPSFFASLRDKAMPK